ncbi:Zn(II)2Cys6 transcription factor domain-containing protein [Aspergillus tanneri]|nr:uncharacterized protein ATNIH1004_007497 [Aspergillus tanneri]KAA8646074.1 hypothetical protein ATNIH1004_007497 [Aspergillus tanneri]
MQNSSALVHPSSSNLNDLRHRQHVIPSSSTHSESISEISAFTDYSLMDDSSVSHRASISTDDISTESLESWDGDGLADSSPTAEVEVKIHDVAHPLGVASTKTFQFSLATAQDSPLSMGEVTPKVEEVEEVDDLQSIKPLGVEPPMVNADSTHLDSTATPVTVPRKRGRPRKHPLPIPGGQVKITKGRSKTGCITCRRRKKKCDETKPS